MQVISLQQAKSLGLLHYFTGKPCKQGHVTKRQTSDRSCCECKRVRKLSEDLRKWSRDYQKYRRHTDSGYRLREIQKSRKWRTTNPQKHKQAVKNYASLPTSKIKKKSRDHVRRSRIHSDDANLVDLSVVWNMSSGVCYLCGDFIVKGNEQYDHVVPLTRGGRHIIDNVKATHIQCNQRKHTKTPVEFWTRLSELGEANDFQLRMLNN